MAAVDEELYGHRDERGFYRPDQGHSYPPVFDRPLNPIASLRWFLRQYLFSRNLVYALIVLFIWRYLTPGASTVESWSVGWVAAIVARNLVIVVAVYGAWHLRMYTRRSQGESFKYNKRWPKDKSTIFSFDNQLRDNIFWTVASAVPIVSGYEALMLWAHANGYVTPLTWADDPVAIILLLVAIPAFADLHFYAIHRLIHIPWLYERFHERHHLNTNPTPWSGLSMHPVEHLLYWSVVLIHFVVPAHPIHFIYALFHKTITPAKTHAGFNKLVIDEFGDPKLIDIGGSSINHYLHHKYFECNYSNGPFPLDRWFGTYHDGSPAAHAATMERLSERQRNK